MFTSNNSSGEIAPCLQIPTECKDPHTVRRIVKRSKDVSRRHTDEGLMISPNLYEE